MKRLKTSFPIIEKLKGGLIVVFRPGIRSLYGPSFRAAMIKAVEIGGAAGIKTIAQDVRAIKKVTPLPVIATEIPTFKAAKQVVEEGADVLAINATNIRYASELIERIKGDLEVPIMAELARREDGKVMEKSGADLVCTDRCGYTGEELHKREMIQQLEDEVEYTNLLSKQTEKEPDINLVSLLVREIGVPVICEGRIWTPEQACSALKAGAYAVVIGGAITKPNVITRRFVNAMKKC